MKCDITYDTIILEDEMEYRNNVILKYDISYPKFFSKKRQILLNKINIYYKLQAKKFENYCRTVLFKRSAHDDNLPQFEAYVSFKVPFIQNDIISIYFDKYIYSGGAHGTTTRTSDTWDIKCGRYVTLDMLFPKGYNYKKYITQNIISQIEQQITDGNDKSYFEDYIKNVQKDFNTESFYLTDNGIVVYFQQYALAPYSSGIIEFVIPYNI